MRLTCLALLLAVPAHAQERVNTEADGSRTLVNEAFVPAPPASVWQATTTAEGWKSWAVPAAWFAADDPDLLETAYDPKAQPGAAANIQQRFVARLPGRMLVFRTVKTPAGFPHAAEFMRVTQFFEFMPEGEGTRVRLSGAGYPAGAAGDTLLGFFRDGNRMTLDMLARRFAFEPLGFLVGHCWRGTLPGGAADTHCFTREAAGIKDHHEVVRAGKTVYSGDTLYAWRDGALRWTYAPASGGTMAGTVRGVADGLDFGTTDFVAADGKRQTMTTRWVRIGDTAYEARDQVTGAPRATRYTRVD